MSTDFEMVDITGEVMEQPVETVELYEEAEPVKSRKTAREPKEKGGFKDRLHNAMLGIAFTLALFSCLHDVITQPNRVKMEYGAPRTTHNENFIITAIKSNRWYPVDELSTNVTKYMTAIPRESSLKPFVFYPIEEFDERTIMFPYTIEEHYNNGFKSSRLENNVVTVVKINETVVTTWKHDIIVGNRAEATWRIEEGTLHVSLSWNQHSATRVYMLRG